MNVATRVRVDRSGSDVVSKKIKQGLLTVDLIIPAFNEEGCIEHILHDVIRSARHNWFQMGNIYVISDASTDRTDEIVKQVAEGDSRIRLIRKQERKGKQDTINLAFSIINADVVVLIDADVRLANKLSFTKLLHPFQDNQVALVQGGLVRARNSFTIHPAELAAYFDWIVVHQMRKKKAMSWWSIDGRVMALSRTFYKSLLLPISLADDQYIFYSCIKQGRKFVWAEEAVFYYGSPLSIRDFSHQWSRYFFYTKQSVNYFGKNFVKGTMCSPNLRRTILSNMVHHPLNGLSWLLCYGISKLEHMFGVNFKKYEHGFFETESNPLENNLQRRCHHDRSDCESYL